MKKISYLFNYLFLIFCVISISGCMPVVALSPSPKKSIEDSLPESFLKSTSPNYLIVPIWKKSPSYYTETTWHQKTIIGNGFFIQHDEIPNLHNKIPRKVIFGVASLAANTGREVELKSVFLISESIEIMRVNVRNSPDSLFDLEWKKGFPVRIDASQKQILERMFEKNKFDKASFEELEFSPKLETKSFD